MTSFQRTFQSKPSSRKKYFYKWQAALEIRKENRFRNLDMKKRNIGEAFRDDITLQDQKHVERRRKVS